jgi:hypothetical protein
MHQMVSPISAMSFVEFLPTFWHTVTAAAFTLKMADAVCVPKFDLIKNLEDSHLRMRREPENRSDALDTGHGTVRASYWWVRFLVAQSFSQSVCESY